MTIGDSDILRLSVWPFDMDLLFIHVFRVGCATHESYCCEVEEKGYLPREAFANPTLRVLLRVGRILWYKSVVIVSSIGIP